MMRERLAVGLLLSVVACSSGGCSPGRASGDESQPEPEPEPKLEIPYPKLSDYDLFVGDMAKLEPAEGVLFYEVIAQLWSDGAEKKRFVQLPDGEAAAYIDVEDWIFPNGTIVVKNFAFPAAADGGASGEMRHIETRLLIREKGDWTGEVYLWNDEQTDAERIVAGKRVDVGSFEYVVPNTEQCDSCHERDDLNHLLGLSTRQTRREVTRDAAVVDQITWLAQQGLFGGDMPAPVTEPLSPPYDANGAVTPRARSWLHANCAHCHQPGGGGGKTGLVLHVDETHPTKLGICKSPVAAGSGAGGLPADIVPGYPEQSIMLHRITSTDPEVKMPELPNRLIDEPGAELIRAWITAMEPKGCDSEPDAAN
jgi:uncharacterized repeat protein (TIGR03806 family)